MSGEAKIVARATGKSPGPWAAVRSILDRLTGRLDAQDRLLTDLKARAPEKGDPGQNGTDGKDGLNGKDGRAITGARLDDDGRLVLTYGDGEEALVGRVVGVAGRDGTNGKDGIDGRHGKDAEPATPGLNGKDGRDGRDGKDGVDGRNGADGLNGKDGANGLNGLPGQPGKPGARGIGIKSMKVTPTGNLVATYTDGQVEDLGRVRGDPGQPGNKGDPGQPGAPGRPGNPGDPGRDGLDATRVELGDAAPANITPGSLRNLAVRTIYIDGEPLQVLVPSL